MNLINITHLLIIMESNQHDKSTGDNINDPNWQELTTSQVKSEPITVELDKQDQMATSLLTASPQE